MKNDTIDRPNLVEGECTADAVAPNDAGRFDPVISKITKPLKPQGIHAGINIGISIKGNF